jgi:hypothetical protein
MLAGLRRLAVLLVATAVGLGVLAALAGLAFGSTVGRSISVTYYVVGAFLLVLGFFAGARGPLRPRGSEEASDPITGMFGVGISSKGARPATETERKDQVATAGIFLAVGIWLIALGVVIDGSASIV